jgi:hypothetical protein
MIDALIQLLSGVSAPLEETNLPRGYTLPAVVWHVFSAAPDYDLQGLDGTATTQIQFDCYGVDGPSARALADEIKAVLVSFTGDLSDGTNVQASYLDREMAMPYVPGVTPSPTHRVLLQFRVVHTA